MPRRAVPALFCAVAVAEIATLWTALRRYTVGTDGSWFFTDAQWHPPLPPFVLLTTNAALVTALLVVATRPDTSAMPASQTAHAV